MNEFKTMCFLPRPQIHYLLHVCARLPNYDSVQVVF